MRIQTVTRQSAIVLLAKPGTWYVYIPIYICTEVCTKYQVRTVLHAYVINPPAATRTVALDGADQHTPSCDRAALGTTKAWVAVLRVAFARGCCTFVLSQGLVLCAAHDAAPRNGCTVLPLLCC